MAAEPKTTTGDCCVLPPEICTEILRKLPAKSILRCRSVCKSWYSLVSCPYFISDYSLRNLNKYGKRLLLQHWDDLHDDDRSWITFPFSSHDRSFVDSREHDDVPEGFLDSINVRIVGSCNGLICLSRYDHHDPRVTFLIWNPTIRKVVELPARGFPSGAGRFSYYGFGFDFKTGDYKVMWTHSVDSDRSNVCEIYDLRKGVWRDIRPPMDRQWIVSGPTPECYLNGAVHWTGFRGFEDSDRILLSFDMSGEIFRETRMPDCSELVWNYDDGTSIGTRSVTLCGLIHVIVWKMKHGGYDSQGSVWAMEEYGVAESWTKMFNIGQLCAEVGQGIDPNTFHLLENGEILMKHDILVVDKYNYCNVGFANKYEQHLVLYNIWSGECEQLFSCSTFIVDMCLYEESLVLM